ncbi:MAG: hemerythrin domain-containing protein [Proteobacteria bacterium]|nr:hemerythrin domain-containing protein [Pseudomonadota bacterium]
MSQTPEFEWDDHYLLGYAAMDDTHREFVECVDAMLTASDEQFPAALDAFIDHATRHFDQEKEWMSADGFPARDCHVEEHDKVMASCLEVKELVAAGNVEVGRDLARALVDWFPGHADYMDSALANWMVKRAHDGSPLVLRRKKPQASGEE